MISVISRNILKDKQEEKHVVQALIHSVRWNIVDFQKKVKENWNWEIVDVDKKSKRL